MGCSERTRKYVPFSKIKLKCGSTNMEAKRNFVFYVKDNISSGKIGEIVHIPL